MKTHSLRPETAAAQTPRCERKMASKLAENPMGLESIFHC